MLAKAGTRTGRKNNVSFPGWDRPYCAGPPLLPCEGHRNPQHGLVGVYLLQAFITTSL